MKQYIKPIIVTSFSVNYNGTIKISVPDYRKHFKTKILDQYSIIFNLRTSKIFPKLSTYIMYI